MVEQELCGPFSSSSFFFRSASTSLGSFIQPILMAFTYLLTYAENRKYIWMNERME